MNKAEFIEQVAEKAELTKAAAARAVEAIFDTAGGAISEAVHAAGTFALPGFGKFTRKTRAARTGRNPRTGAVIQIPERTTVSFTAGKGLKEKSSGTRKKAAGSSTAKKSSSGASKGTTASRSTASKSGTSSTRAETASRSGASSAKSGSTTKGSGSKSSSGTKSGSGAKSGSSAKGSASKSGSSSSGSGSKSK